MPGTVWLGITGARVATTSVLQARDQLSLTLLIHTIDSQAAIYMAARAGVDADAAGLLARYAGVKMSLH